MVGEDDSEGEDEIEDTLYTQDEDQEFVPLEEVPKSNDDPYPSIEKKVEILEFFRSAKKLKSLDQMKHRYTKLSNLKTLYNWEKQFAKGNTNFC